MTTAPVLVRISFVTALTFATVQPGAAQGATQSQASVAGQHAGHQQPPPPTVTPAKPPDKSAHESHAGDEPAQELPAFIPPLTDEDRKAAFPDLKSHMVHGRSMHAFVLFDQLEWQAAAHRSGINLDSRGWVGFDRDRLWFRIEGDSEEGRVGEAQVHALYSRQFSRWWDVVAGIRQDFQPGPAQTWAAIGVQGLAPYWFEVEATAYVGASGRTQLRFEVEYELLVTNRLVLQPLAEVEVHGKSDPERGTGAGLSATDVGIRLRYELKREFAPYLGVTWNRKYGKTADYAEAAGDSSGGARLVTGLRLWF
jgi:copper resistance protein B